jgi:penicillin amidase
LWQIDLWRKRGLGRLAASFGPGYLAQDVASRAFLYRGEMGPEWRSYGTDTQEICEAFVDGINSFIDLALVDTARLPLEYGLTGTLPEKWSAEDVIRIRSHALTRNALSEVARANILSVADPSVDLLRKNLEPLKTPENASKIDLTRIPMEILDVFKLATANVTFSKERLSASLAEANRWVKLNEFSEVVSEALWTGSNNWAIAPDATSTGRPIIAGDPHRIHAIPSIRYLVHLTGAGIDVVGAGEPSMPGVSMGHNGVAAFTQTIFPADQEDIYVYSIDPDNCDRYLSEGKYVDMQVVEELFEVRNAADQRRKLRFTRHGPVLYQDERGGVAYAIRSVWFEPGSAAYLAGLSTMRAKSLQEFRSALRGFGAPSLNHVYADTSGCIAWLPAGMIPIRPNWDGLLPVKGDGQFEWAGFLEPEAMPHSINPSCGYVYSANEANLPTDWPNANIGYEWSEASRAHRIKEVLDSQVGRHSLKFSAALQADVMSKPAQRLQRLLEKVEAKGNADFSKARDMLLAWDNVLAVDSAPGALSELWFTKHLKPALFSISMPDPRLRPLFAPGDVERILCLLEEPNNPADRDSMLVETLTAAFRDATARLGEIVDRWRWGDLHHMHFVHPLSAALGNDGLSELDAGPVGVAGSASTVMHGAYRPQDFRVTMGASVRFVLDVGAWDNSICINTPGQSGDSRSQHYRDMMGSWANGEFVPLLYSADAIDAQIVSEIELLPERIGPEIG